MLIDILGQDETNHCRFGFDYHADVNKPDTNKIYGFGGCLCRKHAYD